jgi:hypothetical protein
MNRPHMTKTALWVACAALVLSLGACTKTKKTSSAGGGTSTQSVLTFRGGTR